jgi:hypothetical protein
MATPGAGIAARPPTAPLHPAASRFWTRPPFWAAVTVGVAVISLTLYAAFHKDDGCNGCPRIDLR